jgi:diacylglycerol kinase (ATP)
MTWFAIVNPAAGKRRQSMFALEEQAALHGVDVSFVETTSVDEVDEVVRSAVADGFVNFLAVGGDGTTNTLVNSLMPLRQDQRFTLAIVAAGSGSDLVRTFGHSKDLSDGFSRLVTPDRYPIDVGVISLSGVTTFFLNAANVGVAAEAAAAAQRLPRFLGSFRYVAAFWIALAGHKSASIKLEVDRHMFSGTAINVVIANGQFFGGGMNIAPRASMSDGMFDVQVFSGRKRQAFTVMPRVLVGTHLSHRAVQRYVGSHVNLSGTGSLSVEADGERIGHGAVTIDVIPSAIDLVI